MQEEYSPIVGKIKQEFKTVAQCKKTFASFSPLISELAKCLKDNALAKADFRFVQGGKKLSLKFVNEIKGKGNVSIEIAGLREDFPGVPYFSSWDGIFFRLPNHQKKPFVKNGQFVKSGQPLGVVFINKNEQFVLNAPAAGFVYFSQKDEALSQGVSIQKFQGEDVENEPIFYLK